MPLQTKKIKLKLIAYICAISLILNFGFVMANEEVLPESESEAPEIETSDQTDVDEPAVNEEANEEANKEEVDQTETEESADEEQVAVEQNENLQEETQEEIIDEFEQNDNLPEEIDDVVLVDFSDEPIIFVFDSLGDKAEDQASGSQAVLFNSESANGSSTASTTEDMASFSDKTSSSSKLIIDKASSSPSIVNSSSGGSGGSSAAAKIDNDVFFNKPEIIAQWQMLALKDNNIYKGEDDSKDIGAQILPSGEYKLDRQYAICAIVGGDFGTAGSVLANVNYPKDIAYDKSFKKGCGQEKSEVELSAIPKKEALEIICRQTRENNNNLLVWHTNKEENYVYGYEKVCGTKGFLEQDTVSLFCAESSLAFDDPAGEYQVLLKVKDSQENLAEASNVLKYLELTTFENDFSNFQYLRVAENKFKITRGDSVWGGLFRPTVRNIGNTRLQIKIQQDDFNLGKTNGIWNLEYKARVGKNAEWLNYFPEQIAYLKDPLDLGETTNIDLGILIKKYPENDNQSAFSGQMILSAEKISSLTCEK
ncbi:hypothetical protein KAI65_05100 [Candidatus Parcubacteria bacterium]|nr:hypothetical protein [Candidatus Parcubacteria bacterium]